MPSKNVAIVYTPDPSINSAPLFFFYPKNESKPQKGGNPTAAKNAELELGQVCLLPSNLNVMEKEKWEAVYGHRGNTDRIDQMIDDNWIRVYEPDVEEGAIETGSTADYSNERNAIALVKASNDIEWLRLCLAKDSRDSVNKVIRDRIKKLEDDERKRRSQLGESDAPTLAYGR